MVRVKPARSRNSASPTRPSMTSLKFLSPHHPPRKEVNLLPFLTLGHYVERTSISRQRRTPGRPFTSVGFWNRGTKLNHHWANSRWRIVSTSVGTCVQHLWGTSETTYAGTVSALCFASQVSPWLRTGLLLVFCATLHLPIDHPEFLCERRLHHKQCTLTSKGSTRLQQVNPQPIARSIHSIRGDTLPQTSFPLDISRHPPPSAHRLSDPSKHFLSVGFHSMFPVAPFMISFTWVCGLLWGGVE